jgi:hypothetical protein
MKNLLLPILLCSSFLALAQVPKSVKSVDSIKKNSDIFKLDLSHQALTTIPKEVFDLKKLKVLDLSGNKLTSIPADIRKLTSLEVLKLDSNFITSISSDIFLLKNLKDISLSEKVIGKRSALEAIVYLNTIGDMDASKIILEASKENILVNLEGLEGAALPIWKGSTHSLGFIPSTSTTGAITDATRIVADQSLKNSAIKLTLDLLYVEDYPGKGRRKVLIEFSGKNQISEDVKEQVNYALTRNVQEKQFAGIRSVPMVVGLRVGKEGVEFKCTTTNVENENDEKLLSILDSEEAAQGLKLLNTLNPVIPIVTNLVSGIGKQILSRNENIPVQEFVMGLDLGTSLARAKLAQGAYIVAQTGPDHFDWSQWQMSPVNGTIVSKANPLQKLPYNFLIFTISKVL